MSESSCEVEFVQSIRKNVYKLTVVVVVDLLKLTLLAMSLCSVNGHSYLVHIICTICHGACDCYGMSIKNIVGWFGEEHDHVLCTKLHVKTELMVLRVMLKKHGPMGIDTGIRGQQGYLHAPPYFMRCP